MATSIGTLELSALLTVARLGDAAYGLAVRHDLSERTGRDYSVGAIYTTLQRLEDNPRDDDYAERRQGIRRELDWTAKLTHDATQLKALVWQAQKRAGGA